MALTDNQHQAIIGIVLLLAAFVVVGLSVCNLGCTINIETVQVGPADWPSLSDDKTPVLDDLDERMQDETGNQNH